MQRPTAPSPEPSRRRPLLVALPAALFAAIALVFAYALGHGDPSKLPSTMIGRPVPETAFGPLDGLAPTSTLSQGFDRAVLADGRVKVVNFWASWCGPCIEEHPLLIALAAETGVPIYGVNYKDQAAAARRFLDRHGNPYAAIGVDLTGRAAIEWGVYAMPETFVVDAHGRIAFKHVGPLTSEVVASKLVPALRLAARTGPGR